MNEWTGRFVRQHRSLIQQFKNPQIHSFDNPQILPMKKWILIFLLLVIVLFMIKRNNMTWRQSMLKITYPLVMLKSTVFPHEKEIQVNRNDSKPLVDFFSLQPIANNGDRVDLQQFKGKKILLVNTASDCGYTAQYEELETLFRQNKDKLIIIAFPSNDFKQQEKKDDQAIAEFCKINYGISFLLMKKTQVVKGNEQNEVFQWLSSANKNGWCNQQPVWNFSKYLVNEEGVLTHFFAQTVSPLSEEIKKAISR
ncbi:MAG: hypothetical protein RLZZ28_65 [Bacteroidota bacterium]|jgi:glutathione peroxidase